MILRSLLFVPADSERKLAKARATQADALILDLEDSVAPDKRPGARELVRAFVSPPGGRSSVWIRINPVGSADYLDDLDAAVAVRPAGIVLPKPDSPDALRTLDRDLVQREKRLGAAPGVIGIIPVATETPAAVLSLHEYRNPPPRLRGLTWGAEDLSAMLGAATNREGNGEFAFTYRMARSLCLLAARAAGVAAIETLYSDFRDLPGLARVARNAQREGFTGMLAIHPDQIDAINEAFTPSAEDVGHACRVIAAFAGGKGVASLDGKMLDQPHLKQAQQIIALDESLRSDS